VLGISEVLFGKDAVLSMPWQVVDPIVIALPLSVLDMVVMLLWERAGGEAASAPDHESGRKEPK